MTYDAASDETFMRQQMCSYAKDAIVRYALLADVRYPLPYRCERILAKLEDERIAEIVFGSRFAFDSVKRKGGSDNSERENACNIASRVLVNLPLFVANKKVLASSFDNFTEKMTDSDAIRLLEEAFADMREYMGFMSIHLPETVQELREVEFLHSKLYKEIISLRNAMAYSANAKLKADGKPTLGNLPIGARDILCTALGNSRGKALLDEIKWYSGMFVREKTLEDAIEEISTAKAIWQAAYAPGIVGAVDEHNWWMGTDVGYESIMGWRGQMQTLCEIAEDMRSDGTFDVMYDTIYDKGVPVEDVVGL